MRNITKMHSLLNKDQKKFMYYASRIPKSRPNEYRNLYIASPSLAQVHSRFYSIHKKILKGELSEIEVLLSDSAALSCVNKVFCPLITIPSSDNSDKLEVGITMEIGRSFHSKSEQMPQNTLSSILKEINDKLIKLETLLNFKNSKNERLSVIILSPKAAIKDAFSIKNEGVYDLYQYFPDIAIQLIESLIDTFKKIKFCLEEGIRILHKFNKSNKDFILNTLLVSNLLLDIKQTNFMLYPSRNPSTLNIMLSLRSDYSEVFVDNIDDYCNNIYKQIKLRDAWQNLLPQGVIGGVPQHHLIEILNQAYEAKTIFKSDIVDFFSTTNKKVVKKAIEFTIKKVLLKVLAESLFKSVCCSSKSLIKITSNNIVLDKNAVPITIKDNNLQEKFLKIFDKNNLSLEAYLHGNSLLMSAIELRSIRDNTLLNIVAPLSYYLDQDSMRALYETILKEVSRNEYGILYSKKLFHALPEGLKDDIVVMSFLSKFIYVYNRQVSRLISIMHDLPQAQISFHENKNYKDSFYSTELEHRDYKGTLAPKIHEGGNILVSTSRFGVSINNLLPGHKFLDILCFSDLTDTFEFQGCAPINKNLLGINEGELLYNKDYSKIAETYNSGTDLKIKSIISSALNKLISLGSEKRKCTIKSTGLIREIVLGKIDRNPPTFDAPIENYTYKNKELNSLVDFKKINIIIDTGSYSFLNIKDTLYSIMYPSVLGVAASGLPFQEICELYSGVVMPPIESSLKLKPQYGQINFSEEDHLAAIFTRSHNLISIMGLLYDKKHDTLHTAIILSAEFWLARQVLLTNQGTSEDKKVASKLIELIDSYALRSFTWFNGQTPNQNYFSDYIICQSSTDAYIAKIPEDMRHQMKLSLLNLEFIKIKDKNDTEEAEALLNDLDIGIDYRFDLLTTKKGVLPEGGIASPLLANYVMGLIYDSIYNEVKKFGGEIFTYMDDITICFDKELPETDVKKIQKILRETLAGLGLQLSKRKTKVIRGKFKREILGATVLKYTGPRENVTVRLPRDKRRLLSAKIFNLKKFLKAYNAYLDEYKSLRPTEEYIKANYPKGFGVNSHFKVPRMINKLRGELAWALCLSRERYKHVYDQFIEECVNFFRASIVPKIKTYSLGLIDLSNGMNKELLNEIDAGV